MKRKIKTITLTGTELEVRLNGHNCDIRNDGTDTVYASGEPNITAGADGVMSIPSGQAAKLLGCNGTLYLLGTGSVQLCGNDNDEMVFKCAPAGGGSGTTDQTARDTINAHANNTDIHLSAEDVAELVSNENLLLNPDLAVNQRGVSGNVTTSGYFVDGWQLVSGEVTVNADGTLTLNGTMKQVLENATGDDVTASASAGTASYDNGTKTFTLTASGETIAWAKLEQGKHATPFTPPDPATELAKCQRYYYRLGKPNKVTSVWGFVVPSYPDRINIPNLPPNGMRVVPTLTGNAENFLIYDSNGAPHSCTGAINLAESDTTATHFTLVVRSSEVLTTEAAYLTLPVGEYLEFSAEL